MTILLTLDEEIMKLFLLASSLLLTVNAAATPNNLKSNLFSDIQAKAKIESSIAKDELIDIISAQNKLSTNDAFSKIVLQNSVEISPIVLVETRFGRSKYAVETKVTADE